MMWKSRRRKQLEKWGHWHSWFAWRPVLAAPADWESGHYKTQEHWIWWEWVERRRDHFIGLRWEYRRLPLSEPVNAAAPAQPRS